MPAARDAAPLVMLPGTLCDARVFAPVLERLGLGASVADMHGAESAADLARLILARAPKKFSLCAFSLGAVVAFEIVAQAPERVERLALIGGNAGLLSPEFIAARANLDRHTFVAPHETEIVHRMAAEASDETWRQQTAITLSRADSRPRLSGIAVPTLVLCGNDDSICPPELSREIAAAIPRSRLAIIVNAGHYVTLDQPQAVTTELVAWLAMPAQS